MHRAGCWWRQERATTESRKEYQYGNGSNVRRQGCGMHDVTDI